MSKNLIVLLNLLKKLFENLQNCLIVGRIPVNKNKQTKQLVVGMTPGENLKIVTSCSDLPPHYGPF